MREIHKNLIYTIVIFQGLFIFALILPFIISLFLPGDPVLAYLPEGKPNPELYEYWKERLGFNEPLIIRYFMYIGKMFTGQWGVSASIARDTPVLELVMQRLPRTVDLLLLPIVVGLPLGKLLGNISVKYHSRKVNRFIQLLSIVGIAIPIMLFGMSLQYLLGYKLGLFPTTGFKSRELTDPAFVTGFRIIDSLISGEYYFISDYLYHLVLPWTVITIGFTSFIILLTRYNQLNKKRSNVVVTNTLNFGISFGVLFALSLLTEIIFDFNGGRQLLARAFIISDYWVLNALIFLIPLVFVIGLFISNLLTISLGYFKNKQKEPIESKAENNIQNDEDKDLLARNLNPKDNSFKNDDRKTAVDEIKNFLLQKLKSPLTIIGLGIIIFTIIVSIFPRILTPYSISDVFGFYPGNEWQPPSLVHPLGTTRFGRDVLARIIYGMRNSLVFGSISVLIALIGGSHIGIPLSLINHEKKVSSEIIMIPCYIFPFILIAMLSFNTSLILGILMIPIFTHIFAKTEFNLVEMIKKVITYVPLILGFIILLDTGLAFLGFAAPTLFNLGVEINMTRERLYDAPWASLFPGLAIFWLVIGLFLIYAGFQNTPREISREV